MNLDVDNESNFNWLAIMDQLRSWLELISF